jgi:hypothetical protein
VTAGAVTVSPAVAGGSTVQSALVGLDTKVVPNPTVNPGTYLGRPEASAIGPALEMGITDYMKDLLTSVGGPQVRAAVAIDRRYAPIFSDFICHNTPNAQVMAPPWYGLAVGTGTAGNLAPAEQDHPGIAVLNSVAVATTGYAYMTQVANIFLKGVEKTQIVFRIPVSNGDFVMRFGFQDSLGAGATTNAAFLRVTGMVVDGYNRRDGAAGSITGTNFTLLANTWYTGQVEFFLSANRMKYTVWDAAGVEKWSDSANLDNNPSARATGHGLVCYRNNATAGVLMHVDYMDLLMGTLTR